MRKTNLFSKVIAAAMTAVVLVTGAAAFAGASPATAALTESDNERTGYSYTYTDQVINGLGGKNIHHLSDTGISGATRHRSESIPYEGLFGLKAETKGSIVNYTMYTHNNYYSEGEVTIDAYADLGPAEHVTGLGTIRVDESASVDLKPIAESSCNDPDGVYVLRLSSGERRADLYLYYDGEKVYTCKYDFTSDYDLEVWNKLTGKLDPENFLKMYVGSPNVPITYPTSGTDGNCDHVDEWCAISDEVILKKEWSDDTKVYAMVDYLMNNYAYDDWRVETNKNKSRATLAQCWSDDNLWMYGNKVGNCWDFANVLTIMCRHQGIPCTSVDNDGHTLNAVWLHDEWTAIDVSVLVEHTCYLEDTDPAQWEEQYASNFEREYGFYPSYLYTINQGLATPRTTLAGGGANPM